MADLPITMSGMRPTIIAKINGADAQFVLDSGAFYSMISAATAAQFGLRRSPAPHGLTITGIGGSTDISVATVKLFTLAGIPVPNVDFLVGGGEIGGGNIGLLGQNFLQKWDVEYDFAKGVVRLIKADDCKHAMLAYWVTPGQVASTMDIGQTTPWRPHATGKAYVNGSKITVLFDTGAATSILSLKAAARAGVKLDTPGVVDGGYSTSIGRIPVKAYIAPFASFKLGEDEEIKNTRLRIADIDLDSGDMLLGADFFLSHHILISNSQHRVYFTYNGGPVFNLSKSPAPAAANADPAATPDAKSEDSDGLDAPALGRRGAAFAERRDFEHAIADFTHAAELNPKNAEYSYRRGVAHLGNNQPLPAMTDFDHALELDPDYLAALVSRAQLRLKNKDNSAAVTDIDAASRIAAKQADVRFTLADLYGEADLLERAVVQYDLWIANHPDDAKRSLALKGRCRMRALQGQDLEQALTDCNAALRASPKSSAPAAAVLDSRGLVRLRLGDYDKSIADYDDSLRIVSQNPWSLYGRGIDKMRKKKTPEGEADIAAAVSIWPQVADEFSRRGIVP